MASIMSKLNLSRKPNSKVYNHSPTGSNFYGKNRFDLDLKFEPNHAVHMAQETTQKINGCLKVAEEMREGASRVLVSLQQQGEHIIQTHQAAASIDHNLQRGEHLLGSLGGLFSKKWRPKKTRDIKGPVFSPFARDVCSSRKSNHIELRKKLWLTPRSQSKPKQSFSELSTPFERAELEKAKQDDALSDLSNLLGNLKAMAVEMGSEIDRQNKALDHMHDDVDVLNIRMRSANNRFRHLLRR